MVNAGLSLGARGAFVLADRIYRSEPYQAVVLNRFGVGDAFNAGFAAALTEGQNIRDALKFASATAGLSTTKIGTANSMPSREEIEKLL